MFVQVIKGKVRDAEGMRRLMGRWEHELRPGATGFLGTTAGVTEDGTAIALARFESRAAAEANSNRAEQGAWWAEMEKCYEGPVEFLDSDDVMVLGKGGSNDAGFVQVQQGRCLDVEKARAMNDSTNDLMSAFRPDVLGSLVALHGADGRYTFTTWFTSEAEARAGEQKQPTPEIEAAMAEWMPLFTDVSYYDLKQPWLY